MVNSCCRIVVAGQLTKSGFCASAKLRWETLTLISPENTPVIFKVGDSGEYECQLAGDPPTTHTVTLVVHAKRIEEAEVVREEEVVAKVAKVLQRKEGSSSDIEGRKSDHEEEGGSPLLGGGSSLVLAGGCLVVVLVCLLSLGAVRTCLGAEARAGERPMPCTKSTQNRRQRSTSRRRRATTSREGEVFSREGDMNISREGEAVFNNNDNNGVSRSLMEEEEGDFPGIPDWQTEAADIRAGPVSVAKGGIQNVWDRRLSPN